jgi:hypothetical protein
MTTIENLLAKLNAQTALLRTTIPTAKEATVNSTATLTDTDEHDWASYDSSDIHLRTQEWEAQTRPTVIQHFVPKTRKLTITPTQREHANAALMRAMPGVQLGQNVSQRKAHELLVSFLGEATADTIMTGGK